MEFQTQRELGWYLAALLDGEGHLYAGLVQGKGSSLSLAMRAVINNNSVQLLEFAGKGFQGGYVYTDGPNCKHSKEGYTPTSHLVISGKKEMLRFADLVEPFLIIKRRKLRIWKALASTLNDVGKRSSLETVVLRNRLMDLWDDERERTQTEPIESIRDIQGDSSGRQVISPTQ